MNAPGREETAAAGGKKASHAYRNARQSVLLLEHARRSGLSRTFAAGVAQIGAVEAVVRAYRPDPAEASEHAETLRLIGHMREEAALLAAEPAS